MRRLVWNRGEETSVRHRSIAIAILLPALVGALALAATRGPARAHQHGTPAPGSVPGVTTEVLGQVEPAEAPSQALFLLRVTLAPGAIVPPHVHPGTTAFHLASGSLVFTLLDGEARLVRAAAVAATPAAGEAVPLGEEIRLQVGDTLYYDGSALQTDRNDGSEPAVILISNLRGVGEPARRFVERVP